ncbi:uncharacterized protein LOC129587173 [Paramacrobiotus metropolitanus]|uniref:uncharacterized protein LOC129587173 n=1 Tax=Paramacrobiotus metropolitanus TaxID=2943436 RepID=UPI002445F62C|nr:uncharacterized protein LOC129587173 [Paramacrobiotus metropolitanus]
MPVFGLLVTISIIFLAIFGHKRIHVNAAPTNYIRNIADQLTLEHILNNVATGSPSKNNAAISPIGRFIDQETFMKEAFNRMQLSAMMNAFAPPQPRMQQGLGSGTSQGLAQPQSMMINPMQSGLGSSWSYNPGMGMGMNSMGGLGGLGLLGLQLGFGKLLE